MATITDHIVRHNQPDFLAVNENGTIALINVVNAICEWSYTKVNCKGLKNNPIKRAVLL